MPFTIGLGMFANQMAGFSIPSWLLALLMLQPQIVWEGFESGIYKMIKSIQSGKTSGTIKWFQRPARA
jgi:hypothetical protein